MRIIMVYYFKALLFFCCIPSSHYPFSIPLFAYMYIYVCFSNRILLRIYLFRQLSWYARLLVLPVFLVWKNFSWYSSFNSFLSSYNFYSRISQNLQNQDVSDLRCFFCV